MMPLDVEVFCTGGNALIVSKGQGTVVVFEDGTFDNGLQFFGHHDDSNAVVDVHEGNDLSHGLA